MMLSVTDSLAEWSKAVDSNSTIFGRVGSSPTTAIAPQGPRKRAQAPARVAGLAKALGE